MHTNVYVSPNQPVKARIISAFIGITVFSFLVSFLYGMLIALSPLVYINFLITTTFGLVLGYGVRIISKLFKLLDRKFIISLSIVSGILGIYFSWVAFALYFVAEGDIFVAYFKDFLLVFQPQLLAEIMLEMNEQGLWEIFRVPFKGSILTVIWTIEAGIIIWMPFQLALKQKEAPFSIIHNKWYRKHILEKDFEYIFRKKLFLEEIQQNCINTINALENGKATRFARISVYYLKDEKDQYVSVENVSRDRHGKREDSRDVIHLLKITPSEARTLLEEYRAKEAFIFDY